MARFCRVLGVAGCILFTGPAWAYDCPSNDLPPNALVDEKECTCFRSFEELFAYQLKTAQVTMVETNHGDGCRRGLERTEELPKPQLSVECKDRRMGGVSRDFRLLLQSANGGHGDGPAVFDPQDLPRMSLKAYFEGYLQHIRAANEQYCTGPGRKQ